MASFIALPFIRLPTLPTPFQNTLTRSAKPGSLKSLSIGKTPGSQASFPAQAEFAGAFPIQALTYRNYLATMRIRRCPMLIDAYPFLMASRDPIDTILGIQGGFL